MADDLFCVFVVRFSYAPLKRERIGLAGSFWREREREIAPALRANEHILMEVLMLQKKKGEGRGETKKFQVEGRH